MIVRDETIDVLSRSFSVVARDPEAFGELFYQKLFRIEPDLVPLFPNDLKKQGRKLVSTLGVVVAGLHDVDTLNPVLKDLARRHVGYGVERHHYAIVGKALIEALESVLGEDPNAIQAWQGTYEAVASAMMEAAYPSAGSLSARHLDARAA